MAGIPSIDVRGTLRKLFPDAWLRRLAYDCGMVQRRRKVDPVALFWTLVLGFGAGQERTLAGLRRSYIRATGTRLEESSFYDRFTPGLVQMLKAALGHALTATGPCAQSLRGALAGFTDVLLADATVVRLHRLLARVYPATRTNHTRAAVKLHAVMSVTGAGRQSLRFTAERRHEVRMLKVGPWVAGRLLLFDLGFFSYGLFARLSAQGGYFVSRLKARANPTIVAVHRVHRGRARDLVGKPLADVLPGLQRQVLDAEVELSFKRRRYRGRRRTDTLRLRLVGLREATSGEYHLYLTNIPPKQLPAEDLSRTYALRWVIELLFKELKSSYRLDEIPSRKSAVVEALLYAALLTFVASRRLLQVLHEALAEHARRLKTQRWAKLFATLAPDLLLLVLWPAPETRALAQCLSTLLLHEAPDPNVQRLSLLEAVETRAHAYRPRNMTARAPMPASSC